VGLAGEEDLNSPIFLAIFADAWIGEEEAGALVGCHAAGKSDGQDIGVELLAGAQATSSSRRCLLLAWQLAILVSETP